MDIIIPIAVNEFYISQKTIKNIHKYFAYENIYVITTKKLFRFYKRSFLIENRVTLLDEDDLIPGLSLQGIKKLIYEKGLSFPKEGWYFQQFLKMAFAQTKYAKSAYLIWDADTIPLTKIEFINKRNNMDEEYLFNIKTEYHVPYFTCIKRILRLEKVIEGSFITEHMIIDVRILKEMLSIIETNDTIPGHTWYEKIINSLDTDVFCGFSEFETYGTFIYSKYPTRIRFRELRTLREGEHIFGRGVTEKELLTIKNLDTISFESAGMPRNFWRLRRDIILRVKQKLLRKYLHHN